jgi:Uncharacterized alpha/beta hydrolase domain (DUF2235)
MSTTDPSYVRNQSDPAPGLTDPVPGGKSAQTARRAPGQRALTAKEHEQRQLALGATVPSKDEVMCQCTKVLHFSVFFDGTGNNREQEMAKGAEKRALSNIAKLFDAHVANSPGVRARYIPGVGTPYAEIGDSGGVYGSAIGTGADKRIKKALELLDEQIEEVPAQQRILLINVVVFGFSRGAAQARAFVRDLAARCAVQDGAYRYRDKPLRVAFSGLFDTVCSAYGSLASATVTSNGGHNGWASDMKLPPMVEQTVHMTAAHEARRRFPLDSTRIDASYPDNTVEIWYPGVHSDVGGGYAPLYQGRENTVSRFALNHMFDLAYTAGVLLNKLSSLAPEVQDEFNKSDPALRDAFNAYIDAVPLKTGPMEQVQAAHMELLHRWLKKRVTSKTELPSVQRLKRANQVAAERSARLNERRMQLLDESGSISSYDETFPEAQRAEYDAILKKMMQSSADAGEIDDALDDLAEEDAKYIRDVAAIELRVARGGQLTLRERTIKAAWNNKNLLPESVETFFDLFAHDSVAHFDYDTSRLTDWRTIYFGDTKYKPS